MNSEIPGLRRDDNFKLTRECLASKVWLFEKLGEGAVSPHCLFLSSGYVGGVPQLGSCGWDLIEDHIVFCNSHGVRMAIFDRVFFVGHTSQLIIIGKSLFENDVTLILHEREPISRLAEGLDHDVLQPQGVQRRRRNLVVIRANEHSVHPSWPIDIPAADRTWDLCTSFYGKEASFPPKDFAEYHVLQNKDQKWPAIHKLFHRSSAFWDYEYFLFPDDDIETSWGGINRMFEICRRQGLHLAQPALAPGSFYAHPITLRNQAFSMRFTNFVEIMTPMFSRFALEVCAPTFATSQIGCGLDYIWPHLLGNQTTRTAIIDETPVLHGRPIGQRYDIPAAYAEMVRVMAEYGASVDQREFGGITA